MRSVVGNIVAVGAMGVTALLFEFGLMAPGDAFFAVAGVLAIYTAYQLLAWENRPLREAVVNMLTRPRSYGGRGAFAAYVGTSAVGAVVIAQTLVYL